MTLKTLFLIVTILYLLVGAGFQIYSCATYPEGSIEDGTGPDIPCAGIPWTPIIIFGWPLIGMFSLIYGITDNRLDLLRQGILTGLALFVILVIVWLGARKAKKNRQRAGVV